MSGPTSTPARPATHRVTASASSPPSSTRTGSSRAIPARAETSAGPWSASEDRRPATSTRGTVRTWPATRRSRRRLSASAQCTSSRSNTVGAPVRTAATSESACWKLTEAASTPSPDAVANTSAPPSASSTARVQPHRAGTASVSQLPAPQRIPSAAPRPASARRTLVLPMPGSPLTSTSRPRPSTASRSTASSSSRTASRPTSRSSAPSPAEAGAAGAGPAPRSSLVLTGTAEVGEADRAAVGAGRHPRPRRRPSATRRTSQPPGRRPAVARRARGPGAARAPRRGAARVPGRRRARRRGARAPGAAPRGRRPAGARRTGPARAAPRGARGGGGARRAARARPPPPDAVRPDPQVPQVLEGVGPQLVQAYRLGGERGAREPGVGVSAPQAQRVE